MSALVPFKFPDSGKYDAILDSFVTTTTTMHVRVAKALFYVITYKVYTANKFVMMSGNFWDEHRGHGQFSEAGCRLHSGHSGARAQFPAKLSLNKVKDLSQPRPKSLKAAIFDAIEIMKRRKLCYWKSVKPLAVSRRSLSF